MDFQSSLMMVCQLFLIVPWGFACTANGASNLHIHLLMHLRRGKTWRDHKVVNFKLFERTLLIGLAWAVLHKQSCTQPILKGECALRWERKGKEQSLGLEVNNS